MILRNYFCWHDDNIVLCRILSLWWLFKVATKSLTLTSWREEDLHLSPWSAYTCFGQQASVEVMLQVSQGYIRRAYKVPPGPPGMALSFLTCSLLDPKCLPWATQDTWKDYMWVLQSAGPTKTRLWVIPAFICIGCQIIPAPSQLTTPNWNPCCSGSGPAISPCIPDPQNLWVQ